MPPVRALASYSHRPTRVRRPAHGPPDHPGGAGATLGPSLSPRPRQWPPRSPAGAGLRTLDQGGARRARLDFGSRSSKAETDVGKAENAKYSRPAASDLRNSAIEYRPHCPTTREATKMMRALLAASLCAGWALA